tara:strand:+ start:352 stop:747 length:396 start_codon:yes stop_codon:yes gene_type:complete
VEKFLDERLELFPLVKTIEDPGRRSRAYVAVRDAGTEQELARYGDYLRTIGGDVAKQMDLDAFREKADGIVGRIPDMTTRLKAVKAVAQAGDIATLRKLIDRAEEILEEQNDTSRVLEGEELVEAVGELFR